MYEIDARIRAWLPPDAIESSAMRQLQNVAQLPFVFRHVAVMPDCHLGKGATVGSVLATQGAVIPAAVGVDIGCGMIAVRTKFAASQLPADLTRLRQGIEARIPLGVGGRNRQTTRSAAARLKQLADRAPKDYTQYARYWPEQLGSLGAGNHFIELCLDEADRVWAVLHSGSRGVGNRIAEAHIRIAQRLMESGRIRLPDRDLAYLSEGSREFDDYQRDLHWAQEYARLNRDEMMDRVLAVLAEVQDADAGSIELERINCHHNFTQRERHFGADVWVTRKGAIQMRRDQRGVIPGSMGTRSYIVSGLENADAYHSAPHGAGRRFSRAEARRRFTMQDFTRAMSGIECRHSEALLDELPGAYKDIDAVMENARDLVRIDHVLRQIVNVKGD